MDEPFSIARVEFFRYDRRWLADDDALAASNVASNQEVLRRNHIPIFGEVGQKPNLFLDVLFDDAWVSHEIGTIKNKFGQFAHALSRFFGVQVRERTREGCRTEENAEALHRRHLASMKALRRLRQKVKSMVDQVPRGYLFQRYYTSQSDGVPSREFERNEHRKWRALDETPRILHRLRIEQIDTRFPVHHQRWKLGFQRVDERWRGL